MLSAPDILTFDIPAFQQPGSFHRLSCARWGNPENKRVLLCVHGLTRNGRDFDMLAQSLADEYQVLCPDMPGRGKSEWLSNIADYNSTAYVMEVVWMLSRLDIPQVFWLGTSMGGIMGMTAANTHPQLFKGLIINDVGALIPASGMARIKEIGNAQTVFNSYAEAEAAFKRRSATFGITDSSHWELLFTHGLEQMVDGKIRFTYDPAIFTAGFKPDQPVTDVDLWPFWERVKAIPTLLIRGAQSDILPKEVARQMQENHPNLTLIEVEGAGHAPALMEDKQIAPIRTWMSAIK